MHERGARLTGLVGAGAQRHGKHSCCARVAARCRDDVVGDQLGLHDDPHVSAEWFDLVDDGGYRPLDQRDQSDRMNPDAPAARRDPFDVSFQNAQAEVEGALMGRERTGPDIEGLVVNQQADHLGIGDVDHQLARLGVAVSAFGVGQRT